MAVGWEGLLSYDSLTLSVLWEVVTNYCWSFIFNRPLCAKYGIRDVPYVAVSANCVGDWPCYEHTQEYKQNENTL